MSQIPADETLTRRGALKLFGIAAGGALALPLVPSKLLGAGSAAGIGASLTIGVIRSSSTSSATSDEFERGLRMALDAEASLAGRSPSRLIVRSIVPGVATARRAFSKLAAERNVDVIVGALGAHLTGWLRPLIESSTIPYVEANFGENVARPEGDSPLVVRSTLGYWQASWALGAITARSLGSRSLVVTTMRDCGFDTLRAWQLGVREAGGNVEVHILDADSAIQGLDRDLARAALRADHIHLLVRPDGVTEARRALSVNGLTNRLPVVSSVLSSPVASDGCSTWFADIANRSNRSFVAAYNAYAGIQPSPAVALGFDTGRLIGEAAATGTTRRSLASALTNAAWRGTRGRTEVVAQSHSLIAPIYLRASSSAPVALSTDIAPRDTDRRADVLRNEASGWLDSYIG